MKAVTIRVMRSLEASALAAGHTEASLMQDAGEQLAVSLTQSFPNPGTIIAYLGKGHNAGDALVALKTLRDRYGWSIAIRSAFPVPQWAPLTQEKFTALGSVEHFASLPSWASCFRPLILLDALVGIGATGPLREPLISLSQEMAWLRNHSGAKVAALDVPSGVDPDTGDIHPNAVIADATFMIGAPKVGLLAEHAANAVGALYLVPVPSLDPGNAGDLRLIHPSSVSSIHEPRPFNFHKGNAGRVGILAGSSEYSGAAILASTGALRGGAGLITLHVPHDAADAIICRLPPEVIVKRCKDPREILEAGYDALVVGCGLYSEDDGYRKAVRETVIRSRIPTVIDAEALNLLSADDLVLLEGHHLLTPHPGEFRRLAPDLAEIPRERAARMFADRTNCTLLLKGCRTIVTSKDDALWFNSTGTPGMATGGQGDLLAGVLGALLAIGNPAMTAAGMGAWICGRAAERALFEPNLSPQSLVPSDIAHHLGGAFKDWSARSR